MQTVTLAQIFLAFLFYSFLGWFYESTIWAPCEKKEFINRGFLLGPICPIYGIVVIMDYVLLNDLQSLFKIWFTSACICCFFEYFISYIFEKLFHARWWDYSNYAFNLNGRISLYSSILFGCAGLFAVKLLHPFTISVIQKWPLMVTDILAGCIAVLLTADVILTSISLLRFNAKVEHWVKNMNERMSKPFDYLNDHREEISQTVIVKQGNKLILKFEDMNEKLLAGEVRLLKAFPDFTSLTYPVFVDRIKNFSRNSKKNKKNSSDSE